MLLSYLSQTRRLLQNPSSPVLLYSDADLTVAINEARQQLAAESASIRVLGTLAVTGGSPGPYSFSAISLGSAVGVRAVMAVRTMWFVIASGQQWITPRGYEWFGSYVLNSPVPQAGAPNTWSQLGQGENGTIFLNVPDMNYTLNVDTVCVPIDLVDDTTAEAIPPLWQSAVQYFAAYTALLGSQTSARVKDADEYLQRYELFVQRARKFATPEVMPLQYSQVPLPFTANQLGQGQPAGGGQRGAPG